MRIESYTPEELKGVAEVTGTYGYYDPVIDCVAITTTFKTYSYFSREEVEETLAGYLKSQHKSYILDNLSIAHVHFLLLEIPLNELPLIAHHKVHMVSALAQYRLRLGK